MTGGVGMKRVFSKKGTDRNIGALEQKNVQRMVLLTLFMTILSLAGIVTGAAGSYGAVLGIYAVGSVAFGIFGIHMLQKKSRRSDLWLFQMIYLVANSSVLTYLSYFYYETTGSFLVYGLVIVLNSCGLLFQKGEYLLCMGIEAMMPLAVFMESGLSTEQWILVAGCHGLGMVVAYERYRGAALAEAYKRKYVEEVKAAERDPLTKVNNRRGMMRKVVSVWPALEENHRQVAVMVVDVDHFKKYNDRFGHPMGDRCLCQVAQTLQRTVQGYPALVSRIGGEEFLVFLHGVSEERAFALAEQMRENVEELGIPHSEAAKYRNVTISVGVAIDYCSSEISFGGLYRRADKELYRAKNLGRNRISCRSGVYLERKERKMGGR